MSTLRTLSLLVATVSMALGAGVFADWSHTIMRGLGRTDDRTFVTAFQQLDTAILNGWFIGFSFIGALVFGTIAAILNARTPALWWIVLALVLHLVVVVLTISINVPMNDALKAAGDPNHIPDLAAVRAAFDEAKWRAWNLVRTVLDVAAFVSLAWALVLHGRATGAPTGL
ncbi:DUF1772 domain-containing protein [Pseudonocardia acaciae]|uniref:anthrone oxygenase family protein n=1 Tax=Pseudonocardia acaciae TaxID=551276 RepID=UPI00048CB07D|nr:DUF1772 domain-containing protein [Pseudonocardia acaciae]